VLRRAFGKYIADVSKRVSTRQNARAALSWAVFVAAGFCVGGEAGEPASLISEGMRVVFNARQVSRRHHCSEAIEFVPESLVCARLPRPRILSAKPKKVISMEKRQLGKRGPRVSALGLGCMGMSFAYGPADEAESLRVLRRYIELGGNFLDTAEIYGPYTNEELLGRFLREVPRDNVVVATKFGFRIENGVRSVDSSPANVRRACDASLERLGIETIDLYYQHRVDPKVPIEETVGAMAELVKAGKVRTLGLSEAGPETLRRAAKIHPVAALQSEYSLWSREVESNGVLATCRELGITFVPYSPLGRGFLTGAIQKLDDLDPSDWRRTNPRFGEQALQANLRLAEAVKELAAKKNCTPAQLALAWVLAQGKDLVPIPGTKRVRYLEDNMGAINVKLTDADRKEIDARLKQFQVVGERYAPDMMALVQRA
jgi:aryl-alcohol dehydrogenase-like predicted oxidoreductase